jgi:hypothetical protein
MEAISRAIINQILHHPTVQLKATKDYEILRQQAEALRTLFNLDPLSPLATNSMTKFASQQSSACAEARKSRAMQEKIHETAPSSQRPILN